LSKKEKERNIQQYTVVYKEITEMGKTWREVKALANQRRRWRSFTGALCSTRN
jgi:hypothetical protein